MIRMNNQEILKNLADIVDNFNAVLLDAYGVFWGGNDVGVLPGSAQVMESLVLNRKIVGILSNSTQLVAKELEKYKRHGVEQGRHFHFLLTSGEYARSIFLRGELPFQTSRHTYWVFGREHPRFTSHQALFTGSKYMETPHLEEADFIYIGIPHIEGEDQENLQIFRKEVERIIPYHLPMVCANPDRFAHEGKPAKLVVRQGGIAALYEEMGGVVFYIGKPYPQIFQIAMQQFREHSIENPQQIVMVGDTPETDIKGANEAGIPTALVTHTGVMAERIAHLGQTETLSKLTRSEKPTYYIERI